MTPLWQQRREAIDEATRLIVRWYELLPVDGRPLLMDSLVRRFKLPELQQVIEHARERVTALETQTTQHPPVMTVITLDCGQIEGIQCTDDYPDLCTWQPDIETYVGDNPDLRRLSGVVLLTGHFEADRDEHGQLEGSDLYIDSHKVLFTDLSDPERELLDGREF